MSIFTKSSGEISTVTSYENKNKFILIPRGEKLLCNVVSVDEAENSTLNRDYEKQGSIYIAVELMVVEGEYYGVEFTQKLYINNRDAKIQDRLADIFSVYNAVTQSRLAKAAQKLQHMSELDEILLSKVLVGAEVVVKVGLMGEEYTDENGEKRLGNKYFDKKTRQEKWGPARNYVDGISVPTGRIIEENEAVMKQSVIEKETRQLDKNDYDDDEIPF